MAGEELVPTGRPEAAARAVHGVRAVDTSALRQDSKCLH